MSNKQTHTSRTARLVVHSVAVLTLAQACRRTPASQPTAEHASTASASEIYIVHDTTVDAGFDAAGVAAPVQQATLGTRLMGVVTDVLVREGDRVEQGQELVDIDARDLTARSAQVAASVTEADAVHRDAVVQANRIRALFADSAATRAQLDAAETGLARADAALRTARAAASELEAINSYSVVRAPFAGIVTKRFVDRGAIAAPGAPLVAIQDMSTLRISASATPEIARGIHRGQSLAAFVERTPVRVTVEGVVPAMTGNLYTINALVANSASAFLAGSRATVTLPTGERRVFVVPSRAITREGDLTGVAVESTQGVDRRWIHVGRAIGEMIEVTAGLRAGDRVVVPTVSNAARAGN